MSCSSLSLSLFGDSCRNLLKDSIEMIDLSARSLKAWRYLSRCTSYLARDSSVTSAGSFFEEHGAPFYVLHQSKPICCQIVHYTIEYGSWWSWISTKTSLGQTCRYEWPLAQYNAALLLIAICANISIWDYELQNNNYIAVASWDCNLYSARRVYSLPGGTQGNSRREWVKHLAGQGHSEH